MRFFHHNLDFSQAFKINTLKLKKEVKSQSRRKFKIARCMVKLEFEKKTQRILFSFSKKSVLSSYLLD